MAANNCPFDYLDRVPFLMCVRRNRRFAHIPDRWSAPGAVSLIAAVSCLNSQSCLRLPDASRRLGETSEEPGEGGDVLVCPVRQMGRQSDAR